MKLFSSTQMSWEEPYFFIIRLREAWGWRRRALLFVAITAVMFVAIHFARNPQLAIGKTLALSLASGAVLLLLMDVGNIQREVTIKDDSIIYNSAMGHMWFGSFKLTDIRLVHLMRPEDWNKAFSGMVIQTDDDSFLLGVPKKVSLDTIANVLHRLGVNVMLIGWEPSESDTRVQVKDEVALPDEATRRFAKARIWPVEKHEARLSPTSATAIAIVMALGPLFLSLVGLIAAGVYLFLKWGALTILDRCLIGGGAFAALVISFLYLLLIGQFLAARYSISVGKAMLRTRSNARFSGDEAELVPVEIFDRTAWTSMVSKSVDFGFLQIDGSRRQLTFEGDKHRWDIPAGALTTCRVEEAHVGSEGNTNAEKRYYVVIACDHDGQPWEAGMIHTRTQLGNDGKDQRYARAQALFHRISDMVSPS